MTKQRLCPVPFGFFCRSRPSRRPLGRALPGPAGSTGYRLRTPSPRGLKQLRALCVPQARLCPSARPAPGKAGRAAPGPR